ncbi:DNA polymerase III subunit gamma/tau [Rickettsiales bacterium]|nr:DNA polymerase III subunit gamma/tau [Rickettsiales bacterium]
MAEKNKAYKVLANKYRPTSFDDLIGQDVLIRTITNAVKHNRIANAFLLTGIRGVGKTTTARIIARVLNCVGEDGNGGPTPSPCGVCKQCQSIAEDRHPDVIEMDAASHTGVDDIREIIDNAHYLPVIARYKIYIIDEVHMLSKNAFNALLKTLEEPPSHVKFIFATTETRKVPVTILSRCQRFDLRRVENDILIKRLSDISKQENTVIEDEALAVIANASEGSVRDALSMLDQSISQHEGTITVANVREMLGLADHSSIIDIFTLIAEGKSAEVLDRFKDLYNKGADSTLILEEMMEFGHLVTKLKISQDSSQYMNLPKEQIEIAKSLAEKLSMSYLTRYWQMLLKGFGEVKIAPNGFIAAEMLLIRLTYMADLPSPAAIIKKLEKGDLNISAQQYVEQKPTYVKEQRQNTMIATSSAAVNIESETLALREEEASTEPLAKVNNFNELVELFEVKREALLCHWLQHDVRVVSFEKGKVEVNISSEVPKDFIGKVSALLSQWTGERWILAISNSGGGLSLNEEKIKAEEKLMQEVSGHENVSKLLKTFPGAKITSINNAEE